MALEVVDIQVKKKFRVFIKAGGGKVSTSGYTTMNLLIAGLQGLGFEEIGKLEAYPAYDDSYGNTLNDNYGGRGAGDITHEPAGRLLGMTSDNRDALVEYYEKESTIFMIDTGSGMFDQIWGASFFATDFSDSDGVRGMNIGWFKQDPTYCNFKENKTIIPLDKVGAITGYKIIYAGDTIAATDGTLTAQGSGADATFTYTLDGGVIDSVTITTAGTGYIKDSTYLTLAADVTGDYAYPPVIKAIIDYESC